VGKDSLTFQATEENDIALTVFSWEDHESPPYNRVFLRDGKILRIEIYPDYKLTLSNIVSTFGDPEGIYAFSIARETITLKFILDYPSKGLSIVSYTPRVNPKKAFTSVGAILDGDLAVMRIHYYAPTSLETALRDVFLLRPERVNKILSDVQKWKEFGQEVPFAEYDRP